MDLKAYQPEIAEPGLYDMPAALYHADPCLIPSLSSGVARALCNETPAHAKIKHPRLTKRHDEDEASAAMNFGSVVHELLLGKGGGFAVLNFEDWRTKAAKEAKAEAIAAGKTPIKLGDFDRAELAAEHIREKIAQTPECADALTDGASEVVGIWQEPSGPWCRAMFDRLKTDLTYVYDIKTTAMSLDDHSLSRNIAANLDIQPAFYLRGLWAICPEMANRTKWRWIFCEVEAPFEIRVIEADAVTLAMGGRKAVYAIDRWRECLEKGAWPGYPRKIERPDYPQWAESAWLAKELALQDQGIDVSGALAASVAPEMNRELIYCDTRVTP